MPNHVYILYSELLGKYYIGSTNDLQRRLTDHNRGKEKFTKTGAPWQLLYFEAFDNLKDARRREREIKMKKSRKYIEEIIRSAV